MDRCFVIQPFDRGRFDKRFQEIFRPAIEAAGLEAYRVDQDPAVSIPIDQIESGIRDSRVCFAEITTDNPNVWFELGYSIAIKKDVILVCSDERSTTFPFDVQHRKIITYKTESTGDFDRLQKDIAARLKALLEKEDRIDRAAIVSPVTAFRGLEQHEMVALVTIAENIDGPADSVHVDLIKSDMQRAGFTKVASMLGLTLLLEKGLIAADGEGIQGSSRRSYRITDNGLKWLIENQELVRLRQETPDDDDTPF